MDWAIQATCEWNFNGFSKWLRWSSFSPFRYKTTHFYHYLLTLYCNPALKQSGQDCNPVVVRKAIENSSLMPKDNLSSDALQLTYGCGLLQVILQQLIEFIFIVWIQVDRVWAYLEANKDSKHSHVRFNIQVNRLGEATTNENNKTSSSIKACSGIYIREPKDVKNKLTYMCNVTPLLHEVSHDEVL